MTLSQLLSADVVTQKQYALVFESAMAGALAAKWQQHGTTVCVPTPRPLTDGRFMLCADILSEVHPGGLLHAMWQASDHAAIVAGTTVLPWSEAVAMIPPSEGLQ